MSLLPKTLAPIYLADGVGWEGEREGGKAELTCTIDHNPVYTNTWWTSHAATMSTDIKREYGALINLSDS